MREIHCHASNSPATLSRPDSVWLLSYPEFREALQRDETSFRFLPLYAKLPVIRRLPGFEVSSIPDWSRLDEIRVSYVELGRHQVEEAVRSYLAGAANDPATKGTDALATLAAGMPPVALPLVARPPCLLSPGKGVFLEGWAAFLTYWSRSDRTIPLLAVDWQSLYGRLTDNEPGRSVLQCQIEATSCTAEHANLQLR